jgi:proteasome assembly chaperone (PAC2) family protein
MEKQLKREIIVSFLAKLNGNIGKLNGELMFAMLDDKQIYDLFVEKFNELMQDQDFIEFLNKRWEKKVKEAKQEALRLK